MFEFLKSRNRHRGRAMDLYECIVSQAREPFLYEDFEVPDTPDGRYDMIMMHAFLVLHRLKRNHAETKDLGQAVFDVMFEDMDKNLREMGAGDIGVSHRIKDMAKAFFGRISAYDEGIRGTAGVLEEALKRNVYRNSEPDERHVSGLAAYMRMQSDHLDGQHHRDMAKGRMTFANAVHAGPKS